ncbi:hypothetical protein HPE56_07475 [Maribacter sp. ANRC-HE7]|uniref:Uncharacterized protein n=1 Tax=Maribacter aquimaris TaxID=2737171 RepID=A0ABR7UYL9_9FLAO|nr:hypothetical protein [Maribacter aquimaris]MBD0777628.1 hypothetical protein [Maribacter aquimaris]
MSGAGHMLHAIKSLKFNRDQLKNRRSKNRHSSSSTDTITKVEFKKVSPEELQKIKSEIRAQAKKSKRKELILSLGIICVLIAIAVWMYTV